MIVPKNYMIRVCEMKNLIFGIFAAVIISDSTSHSRISLREKYGPTIEIDSVTLVLEQEGRLYITRNKKMFGIFPFENYSLLNAEEK
jgi:hypothetical protein